MAGTDWADYEVATFNHAHPDFPTARKLNSRTIWLPQLPGLSLRNFHNPAADLSAFAELDRFHRIASRMIHGDPHGGNFLHDPADGRSRIIDFETRLPAGMPPQQGRARDFLILALDLLKNGRSPADFPRWREAYANDESFSPVATLCRHPGHRLETYWRLLGYGGWRDFQNP